MSPKVSLLNFCSYLINALLTINILVWTNSSAIFVLSYLATDGHKGASFAGTLLLADELLSLFLVIVWGRLVDRISLRFVACAGHCIAALGLIAIASSRKPVLQLLPARLLFAVGHSALTTVLSAGFALVTAPIASLDSKPADAPSEDSPLLEGQAEGRSSGQPTQRQNTPASLYAGIGGLASGCGALLAVFVFLPMPPKLTSPGQDLGSGVQKTYWLVAALEIIAVAIAFYGLNVPQKAHSESKGDTKSNMFGLEAKRLLRGFALAKDPEVLVSYAGSLVARSQTVTVALCIPIMANAYFIRTGHCKLDDPNVPPEKVKEGCHAAFALAAALTGTVQTVGLLSAPLAGYLGSRRSITKMISSFALCGAVGFLLYGNLPDQNPKNLLFSLPASILVGLSQTSCAVLNLALTAKARARLVKESADEQGEIAGALSAGVSFFSGCGVIAIGQTAGALAELAPTAPFLLVAGLNAALVVFIAVYAKY